MSDGFDVSREDLMIVDMRLAGGTDAGAVERISQSGPVPHIFISGDPRQTAAPAAPLLRKPFSEAELGRAIQRTPSAAGAAVG